MDPMDLNILTLVRQEGQDRTELPGLYIPTPPRRPARGRQQDRLVFYLVVAGNAPLAADQQNQLLSRLAQTYYKTPGSSTAAQRAVAEALNEYLLDRNLKAASGGRQAVGMLVTATVRNNHLYLAQSGPTHAFLITAAGVEYYHDTQAASRGLGLGRTAPILYSQAELRASDTLLISAEPPATWSTNTLNGLHNQGPESLRRTLLSQAGNNVSALMIQAKTGSGKVVLLQPKSLQPSSPVRPLPTQEQDVLEKPPIEAQPATAGADSGLPETVAVAAVVRSASDYPPVSPAASSYSQSTREPEPLIPEESSLPPRILPPAPARDRMATSAPPGAAKRRIPRPAPMIAGVAAAGGASKAAASRIGDSFRRLLVRILPGEDLFTIPSSIMIFVAIAVPLIVVAIASVVYFQRGRSGQYQAYYAQAIQAAGFARNQTDPNARMQAWQTVINFVEQAEQYQVSGETQALRQEASSVYDEINSVRRLDYQPAIVGAIPDNADIISMVATESDLYLLNRESGGVIRALATNTGYKVDPSFQCASGFPAGQTGQLIDIAAAPKGNSFNATVQALDVNGNLLQCLPGQPPIFTPLAPPSKGWGRPQAFTTNLGNLFILDTDKKTVWIYWNSQYDQPPEEAFVAGFPIENAVDLAVDKTDIYLLHADGHTTFCVYSDLSVSPSNCTDPAPYIDSRPGYENQVLIPEKAFSQLLATLPPDPSLYYLEPAGQALYRFSLRLLTYYGQYLPRPGSISSSGLAPKPATAFTLSPDGRLAFLAISNQVYYAGMP